VKLFGHLVHDDTLEDHCGHKLAHLLWIGGVVSRSHWTLMDWTLADTHIHKQR